jgi:broad specificity phosphatase PhoE
MELFITRHPLTEENKRKVIQSHHDSNISAEGKVELRRLIKRLKREKISFIYSSDSPRCVYAGERISSALKIPVEFTELLREYNRGDLVKAGEVVPKWGAIKIPNHHWVPNNGESIAGLYERIDKVINAIGIDSRKRVLFVTHSFVAKAIVSRVFGLNVIECAKNFSISNCSLTKVSYKNGTVRIGYLNSYDFLKN